MEIAIPLQLDSDNTYTTESLRIRRGNNRPENAVIEIGDRQIEVDFEQLKRAVSVL